MLRLVEEILLLTLHDDGRFLHAPSWSMDYAIAGGVLMDLAMENRIDTDLEKLILVSDEPVGDSLLDPTLVLIASGEPHDARYWVGQVAQRAGEIREEAFSRLVDVGILERHEDRFLWVFRSRRYPLIKGRAVREVKQRIMGVLFSDEIPEPHDVMLIALADACDIFKEILTHRELEKAAERIETVSRLELISQAMFQAIHDIKVWVATSVQAHMH